MGVRRNGRGNEREATNSMTIKLPEFLVDTNRLEENLGACPGTAVSSDSEKSASL